VHAYVWPCRERDALEQNCLEARAELAAMQVSLQQVSKQGPAAGSTPPCMGLFTAGRTREQARWKVLAVCLDQQGLGV
jgi:hypothetical protein